MAGGEIYRVEIPIIVDDQTDKPLQQAEQKISKLEQHARKENERMRQHFMKIARLQIEPVMKVRDHLTSGVLKADRLIRKLDMAQASPLIAAQDRVSAVVTRTNAMLDALDKGKVDVAAEMKGPLLDEIVKAKSALAVLNNVKAGPVAELRGELFGQLTKAMSQIKGLDLTRAEPQATLREKVTMKVREIGNSLRSLTARAWDITLQVKDKVTGFFGRIGRMLTTPLGMMGMGGMTLGPVALISNAIKTAGEFEQAMANVQSVAGASREELARLREAAAKAGRETVFKASEAADALYYLALAGFNVDQQIGALSGTLALAAATQSDLAFTSETIASTISAFGLEAEEADRVANVFAATIGSSQASMDKLAQSMRYAGSAAAGFGRSLEETAATLALFYNMGLTGEMAGTRFRTALSALAHPTGDTKNALAELGIKASQVNPAMHSLADIIDLLKDKGVDTAMAMRIFGQETGPAMASLIALGGDALRDMERQITGTNKALEMQEIQLGTLMGAQKELQSVWEAVNITLGTQSIPGLRRLVVWFKQTIGDSEELAKKIGDKLNRAFERLADILESPEFKEATFAGKIKILFTAAIDEISTWLGSSGKEQLSKVFVSLGEASVKAYISGMKALGQRAIQELKQGNVVGAAVPAAAMWFLGGGTLLRGAWGLGKGLFGAGKWALGKLGLGTAGTAAAATTAGTTATTAATTAATGAATMGAVGILGKALSTGGTLAGAAGVISGVYDIYRGYKETDPEEARKRYWAGGTKIGMVGTGAAIGTAIAPGIGTAIGAGIGGIAALLGGTAVGETLRNVWNGFLSWGSKAWDTVGTLASNTWNNITTWASGTWDSIKTGASNAGSWVAEKWNAAGDWISNKWSSFSEWFNTSVWTPVKDVGISAINIAAGAWSEVRDWVGEKWSDFSAWFDESIWTPVKDAAQAAGQWVNERWSEVRTWIGDRWSDFSAWFEENIWTPVKDAAQAASQWVNERWYEVRTWIGDRWADFSAWFEENIWTPVKTGAQAAGQWMSERWNEAKTWVIETWGTVSAWFDETVWQPVKSAAQTAGAWLGEQFTAAKNSISEAWSGVSDWFSNNVWEPIKTGATGAWKWVGEKLGDIGEWIGDKWQSFKDWLEGMGQKGSAVTGLTTSKGKATILEHATGGILTHPHLGLVAEAGPEAIIPLSARMRARALELWQQTGELLGVTPHANTTESAAIALESIRKGQELTTRSIKNYEKKLQKTRTIEETEKVRAEIMEPNDKRQTIIKEFGSILGAIGTGVLVGAGTGMLVGAGVMSPVTAMLGTILGAGAGAFGGQAAASALYDRFSPYATGGILTRPHLGLVAEAGPEAIIPLSTRMRARALALYEETGRRLGVRPYAEGGFAGALTQNREQKIPVGFTPSLAMAGPATINLNFDLTGLVRQVVIESREDIDGAVDKITDAIANNLRSVFQNMTK